MEDGGQGGRGPGPGPGPGPPGPILSGGIGPPAPGGGGPLIGPYIGPGPIGPIGPPGPLGGVIRGPIPGGPEQCYCNVDLILILNLTLHRKEVSVPRMAIEWFSPGPHDRPHHPRRPPGSAHISGSHGREAGPRPHHRGPGGAGRVIRRGGPERRVL